MKLRHAIGIAMSILLIAAAFIPLSSGEAKAAVSFSTAVFDGETEYVSADVPEKIRVDGASSHEPQAIEPVSEADLEKVGLPIEAQPLKRAAPDGETTENLWSVDVDGTLYYNSTERPVQASGGGYYEVEMVDTGFIVTLHSATINRSFDYGTQIMGISASNNLSVIAYGDCVINTISTNGDWAFAIGTEKGTIGISTPAGGSLTINASSTGARSAAVFGTGFVTIGETDLEISSSASGADAIAYGIHGIGVLADSSAADRARITLKNISGVYRAYGIQSDAAVTFEEHSILNIQNVTVPSSGTGSAFGVVAVGGLNATMSTIESTNVSGPNAIVLYSDSGMKFELMTSMILNATCQKYIENDRGGAGIYNVANSVEISDTGLGSTPVTINVTSAGKTFGIFSAGDVNALNFACTIDLTNTSTATTRGISSNKNISYEGHGDSEITVTSLSESYGMLGVESVTTYSTYSSSDCNITVKGTEPTSSSYGICGGELIVCGVFYITSESQTPFALFSTGGIVFQKSSNRTYINVNSTAPSTKDITICSIYAEGNISTVIEQSLAVPVLEVRADGYNIIAICSNAGEIDIEAASLTIHAEADNIAYGMDSHSNFSLITNLVGLGFADIYVSAAEGAYGIVSGGTTEIDGYRAKIETRTDYSNPNGEVTTDTSDNAICISSTGATTVSDCSLSLTAVAGSAAGIIGGGTITLSNISRYSNAYEYLVNATGSIVMGIKATSGSIALSDCSKLKLMLTSYSNSGSIGMQADREHITITNCPTVDDTYGLTFTVNANGEFYCIQSGSLYSNGDIRYGECNTTLDSATIGATLNIQSGSMFLSTLTTYILNNSYVEANITGKGGGALNTVQARESFIMTDSNLYSNITAETSDNEILPVRAWARVEISNSVTTERRGIESIVSAPGVTNNGNPCILGVYVTLSGNLWVYSEVKNGARLCGVGATHTAMVALTDSGELKSRTCNRENPPLAASHNLVLEDCYVIVPEGGRAMVYWGVPLVVDADGLPVNYVEISAKQPETP
ncbi:MAG: hypothetical protein Q4C01_04210, partial [Clostridia bacterium]|nr:hypothetical protein [Clostridia bacterium]